MSEDPSILPRNEVELTPHQKKMLEEIKKNLEGMIQNRRFNPFLLDEMESKSRGILEQQFHSSIAFMASWNRFFELLKQAREDSSTWAQSVEQAVALLNELLPINAAQ